MGLEIGFESRQGACELCRLSINRLDIGGVTIQPGWAVSASPSRVAASAKCPLASAPPQADTRCGQFGGYPHRLEITFFRFLEIAGPKQSISSVVSCADRAGSAGLAFALFPAGPPLGARKPGGGGAMRGARAGRKDGPIHANGGRNPPVP